jgi:two-component system, cell cycle sensor histidine kinase and response regulator CckA
MIATAGSFDRQTASAIADCFDALPGLACVIGSDGRLKQVNRAWFDLLGYPPSGIVGQPFAQFFHNDDVPRLDAGLSRCGPNDSWDRFESRFRCFDGSFKWLLWQFQTDSQRQFVSGVAFDLSDRKDAEAVAARKLTVASLRAQIWAPLANTESIPQMLQGWTDCLQKNLAARAVCIWAFEKSQVEPNLRARSSDPTVAGQQVADFDFLAEYVRQALDSGESIAISDIRKAIGVALPESKGPEPLFKGICLCPIAVSGGTRAIIGVLFPQESGPAESYLVEAVSREIQGAWSHMARNDELRASKRSYDALVRSSTAGISRVDAAGNIKAWNFAAESILRWTSADVLGKPFPIATRPEHDLFATCLGGAFKGQSTARLELKCWSATGTTVDVALSVSPLSDHAGAIVQAMIVFEDLSPFKRASRGLQLQNAVADALAHAVSKPQAMEVALAAIARELKYECGEYWQWEKEVQTLARIASWNSPEPSAATFASESRKRVDPREQEFLSQFLQNGNPARFPCASDKSYSRSDLAARAFFEDGIVLPIAGPAEQLGLLVFFATAIDEPDGQLRATLAAISYQIGQFVIRVQAQESLREAEQDLQQAKKMDAIGRLVGGVVHDFNNVLTVILGYGEMAIEELGGDASKQELLAEMINAGKRAAGLTRQLLAFCRKEAAQAEMVDLNSIVVEMQKMLRRLVTENIQIETSLAPDARRVRAMPGQLEQVVMNLVVNARDAMPQGGRVSIETRSVDVDDPELRREFPGAKPGRHVLLIVSDTGCGMEEATKKRIFEPFFTTKPVGKGTGMGLSTVFAIVNESGGQISVESQPGKGTSFRILFPTVAHGLSSWQIDSAPATIPRGSESILVVEDDATVRHLMTRILRNQGYHVLDVASSQEAISRCRGDARVIDLLIADVVMAETSGVQLAQQLRNRRGALKVLFVSGYGEGEVGSELGPDSKTAFLQKPFTTFDLAQKVRGLCDS